MSVLHAPAVLFATLLVGLLTTGVLMMLPATWQGNGRALRYWIAGNVALSVYRVYCLLVMTSAPGLEWLAPLATATAVLAPAIHVPALRQMLQPDRPALSWHAPVAYAAGVALVGYALMKVLPSTALLMLGTTPSLVLLLSICWPLRRQLRGAWLMSAALTFFLLMGIAGLAELAHGLMTGTIRGGQALPIPTAVLALDLVLSTVVNLAFLTMLIELLNQRVERLSVTDPLTGVFNRRGFLQAANLQLLQAGRRGGGVPTSVLLLDLDHFKRINDTLGHPMGDAVLRGAVERAAGAMRQTDLMARWGGEEFVVLLPGSRLADAHEVAERVRQAMARAPLAEGAPVVTVSIGVATLDEVLAVEQLPALIAEADRRLYAAKRRRNCVVANDDPVDAGDAEPFAAPAAPAVAAPVAAPSGAAHATLASAAT